MLWVVIRGLRGTCTTAGAGWGRKYDVLRWITVCHYTIFPRQGVMARTLLLSPLYIGALMEYVPKATTGGFAMLVTVLL